MKVQEKIEQLSDHDVDKCLHGILKGFVGRNPDYARIVSSSTASEDVLRSVTEQVGKAIPSFDQAETSLMKRQILVALASDPATAPWVEAWVTGDRPTLLEPVTTAIILASIVMALSANFAVDLERKNGKTALKVHVDKKPTAKAILEKFFKIF
jgi:hypothetical protein